MSEAQLTDGLVVMVIGIAVLILFKFVGEDEITSVVRLLPILVPSLIVGSLAAVHLLWVYFTTDHYFDGWDYGYAFFFGEIHDHSFIEMFVAGAGLTVGFAGLHARKQDARKLAARRLVDEALKDEFNQARPRASTKSEP